MGVWANVQVCVIECQKLDCSTTKRNANDAGESGFLKHLVKSCFSLHAPVGLRSLLAMEQSIYKKTIDPTPVRPLPFYGVQRL